MKKLERIGIVPPARLVQPGGDPSCGTISQLAKPSLISTLGLVWPSKLHSIDPRKPASNSNPASGLASFLLLTLTLAVTFVPATQAADIVRLALEHDRLTAGDLAQVIPEWKAVAPHEPLAFAPLPGMCYPGHSEHFIPAT